MQTPPRLGPQGRSASARKRPRTDVEPENCAICLSAVPRPAVVACAHHFCFPCLAKWCELSNSCPLCKRRIERIASPGGGTQIEVKSPPRPVESDYDDDEDNDEYNEDEDEEDDYIVDGFVVDDDEPIEIASADGLPSDVDSEEEEEEDDDDDDDSAPPVHITRQRFRPLGLGR